MLKHAHYSIMLIVLCFLFSSYGWCAAPQTMSFQGYLTGNDGKAVTDGNYDVTFYLYTTETGGTAVWTEKQTITTKKGIYNAILDVSSISFDKQYYLGVKVGNDAESTPRFELTASPYSMMAKTVEDSTITSGKIASSQVIKSIKVNNTTLKDDITLSAGSNVSISNSGNNITINATNVPNGTGDITKVTAGTGLTGGGESGDVTLSVGSSSITSSMIKDGEVNTDDIKDGSVTSGKIASAQVVKSINGLKDDVTIAAGSNVSITKSGQTITVSSTVPPNGITDVIAGSGITREVTSGIITLNVGQGTGITVGADSISLDTTFTDGRYVNEDDSNKITSSMIRDGEVKEGDIASGAVTSAKIASSAVTSTKIADSAVTSAKIANGQVVKSINGQTDAVTIAVEGITIPHYKEYNSGNTLFDITQNGDGGVMRLKLNSSSFSSEAFGVYNNGRGEAGYFVVENSDNDSDALYVYHKGKGKAGYFRISNPNEYSATFSGGRGIKVNGNLTVDGNIEYTGEITRVILSDKRYKKNIKLIDSPLNKILNLRGVKYQWSTEQYPEMNFPKGGTIGLIAQEVEPFIPEVVSTDTNGYKSIAYQNIIPVLIEAMKEQQQIIDKQQETINNLLDRIARIENGN